MDYLILFGAMTVFIYSVFTIKTIPIIDTQTNTTIGNGLSFGVQLIIAPIIILHRIFLILWGPEIPRLREIDWKLKKAIFYTMIHDKIQEGKTLTKEYFENKKK